MSSQVMWSAAPVRPPQVPSVGQARLQREDLVGERTVKQRREKPGRSSFVLTVSMIGLWAINLLFALKGSGPTMLTRVTGNNGTCLLASSHDIIILSFWPPHPWTQHTRAQTLPRAQG